MPTKIEASQCKLIREALERGEVLTSMDALNRVGCFRLASRADDLRKEGMNIPIRQMVTLRDGKSVAIYFDASLMSYAEAVEKRFPDLQGICLKEKEGLIITNYNMLGAARLHWVEGKNLIEVEQMTGISPMKISRFARKHHLPLRTSGPHIIEPLFDMPKFQEWQLVLGVK